MKYSYLPIGDSMPAPYYTQQPDPSLFPSAIDNPVFTGPPNNLSELADIFMSAGVEGAPLVLLVLVIWGVRNWDKAISFFKKD
jgi:hypothetical protein